MQTLAQPFAEVLEAPEAGYFADGDNTTCPAGETPDGSRTFETTTAE